jgi:hypothetical protein
MNDPDALFLDEWQRDREDVERGEWADPADEFWTARPVLEHIRIYARSVFASPWATLGVVLARVVASTPPYVVLPALVGGHGSLNLYVGIVGRPGQGKGAADNAGAACIELPAQIFEIAIGSGEGIAHLFRRRARNGSLEDIRTSAFLTVGEVSSLEALAKRQGSVLMPELRKAWMGEPLGFANADRNKAIPLDRHAYRLCISVGIQPKKAQHLLDDVEAGLPQRVIWLPAIDPTAPAVDLDDLPKVPQPLVWSLPDWGAVEYRSGHYVMTVCRSAQRAIIERRVGDVRGTNEGDPLDAHAGLSRLKIAAGLGLLDGHAEVTESDWYLSGLVMAESVATRDRVVRAIRRSQRETTRRAAEAEAEKQSIIGRRVMNDKIVETGRRMLDKLATLGPDEWITSGKLRSGITLQYRQFFDEVAGTLTAAGQIEAEKLAVNNGSESWRYRLPQQTDHSEK